MKLEQYIFLDIIRQSTKLKVVLYRFAISYQVD